jgi:glycerophosphoryl diester phosphodiesterase
VALPGNPGGATWWRAAASTPPLVIAHRGASRAAPENTLAAFRKARAFGADGVELDVMRCKSGEVVVFHDDDLARLAGRRERIADLPLAALREVDLGGGAGIPTLEEALEEIGDLLVNVELKTDAVLVDDGLAVATAAVLIRAARPVHMLVSSFNPAALGRFRRYLPDMSIGLLFERRARLTLRRPAIEHVWAPLLGPHALHPESALVDAVSLARWRRLVPGCAVNVWTVDDPHEMAALAALGVDAIITNVPDVLRATLSARASVQV